MIPGLDSVEQVDRRLTQAVLERREALEDLRAEEVFAQSELIDGLLELRLALPRPRGPER